MKIFPPLNTRCSIEGCALHVYRCQGELSKRLDISRKHTDAPWRRDSRFTSVIRDGTESYPSQWEPVPMRISQFVYNTRYEERVRQKPVGVASHRNETMVVFVAAYSIPRGRRVMDGVKNFSHQALSLVTITLCYTYILKGSKENSVRKLSEKNTRRDISYNRRLKGKPRDLSINFTNNFVRFVRMLRSEVFMCHTIFFFFFFELPVVTRFLLDVTLPRYMKNVRKGKKFWRW